MELNKQTLIIISKSRKILLQTQRIRPTQTPAPLFIKGTHASASSLNIFCSKAGGFKVQYPR